MASEYDDHKRFLKRLKDKKIKDLDERFARHHEIVFAKTDCLTCANCCKTTSPIFLDKDIERIARHFHMRPSEFVENYLYLDDENDYVLHVAPCPFLGADNYCGIYDVRPKACSGYPHTDRKKITQLFAKTLENTKICPAVVEILERLKLEIRGF